MTFNPAMINGQFSCLLQMPRRLSDSGFMNGKIRKLDEFYTYLRVTNGNFDSCNYCKRMVPSRLHDLHESKFPFVTRIEFIRSKLSNFSADVSGVSVCYAGGRSFPRWWAVRLSLWVTEPDRSGDWTPLCPGIYAADEAAGWHWPGNARGTRCVYVPIPLPRPQQSGRTRQLDTDWHWKPAPPTDDQLTWVIVLWMFTGHVNDYFFGIDSVWPSKKNELTPLTFFNVLNKSIRFNSWLK